VALPELGTPAAGLAVPALPFNVLRLSGRRHSPIYSTLPRTTVVRPAFRCQATSRNEIKLEVVKRGSINVFICTENRIPRHSKASGVGLAKSGIEHGCHRYPSLEGIGAGGTNSGNPVSALKCGRDQQCSDQQS
jgi:hypothetical protein